jgi:hypothetical protein
MAAKKAPQKKVAQTSSRPNNGDTLHTWHIDGEAVRGLGSFHKTLPHNEFGEVCPEAFDKLVAAASDMNGNKFPMVPAGQTQDCFSLSSCDCGTGIMPPNPEETAQLTNPRAGLAKDQLTPPPWNYFMPPAPDVFSKTTSAEMAEVYWMALLRDVSLSKYYMDPDVAAAALDLTNRFNATDVSGSVPSNLQPGIDTPGFPGSFSGFTPANVFRLGLPGEEVGPMISQFFNRDAAFGTQTISQKQRPYRAGKNFLTKFDDWLHAQNTGNGNDGQPYPRANESCESYYEGGEKVRYISTMRDLARFVNKDALHQAYFNAALLMLSSNVKWTPGNPYGHVPLKNREAGFGTLGGPHILNLVSEVATRALKIVWNQKWQVHLRLRPEAFGGLVHVREIGNSSGITRDYPIPDVFASSDLGARLVKLNQASAGTASLLLPMAFTPGSPTHPAYGAGHATVAGACVTILKAYFKLLYDDCTPIPLCGDNDFSPMEKAAPYTPFREFKAYSTGVDKDGYGIRNEISADGLTIEGELNKLAMNVAMGRTMGGVHWRTDNARSLVLGEAIAAHILAEITTDLVEKPEFIFRTFARDTAGKPKIVTIAGGKICVNGIIKTAQDGLAISQL